MIRAGVSRYHLSCFTSLRRKDGQLYTWAMTNEICPEQAQVPRQAEHKLNYRYASVWSMAVLAMVSAIGCSQKRDEVPSPPVQAVRWEPGVVAMKPLSGQRKLTEELVQAFERQHKCKLPADYREFLLEHNGGFPTPDCVLVDESGRRTVTDVFCFFALGDERPWASVEWNLDTLAARLPKDTLPIGRDSCGNLWLIGLGGEQAGAVYFWDHGTYLNVVENDLASWPRIATSFGEFKSRIGLYDAASEDDILLSRYAFSKQSEEAMAAKDPGFTTRAHPEFVWHCACDDDGKAKMEFVNYEAHAVATHTDGYSRLQALKGLVDQGPPRLPE